MEPCVASRGENGERCGMRQIAGYRSDGCIEEISLASRQSKRTLGDWERVRNKVKKLGLSLEAAIREHAIPHKLAFCPLSESRSRGQGS